MFNYLFLSETYEPVARGTSPPFWQILKSWIFVIEACIQMKYRKQTAYKKVLK
jgi:hypothetical protein